MRRQSTLRLKAVPQDEEVRGESGLVDGDTLIRWQLEATEPTDVVFEDGRKTLLMPARTVPRLKDPGMSLSLNGAWRVQRWPFPLDEEKLADPASPDSSWETVEQPGKVFYRDPNRDAAADPNWNRVKLTHIDPQDGAMIRRTVTVPRTWRNRRICVRFDGVYPACRVYCNGTLLGDHLSGLTPVEWDVTSLVHPGKTAVVAVRLLRRHPHVQLDMPRHSMEFAGLSQDACLHATGNCYVADYHLISSLDDTFHHGTIDGTVAIQNTGRTQRSVTLRASVRDAAGQERATFRKDCDLAGETIEDVKVRMELKDVATWNDEFPNLYRVSLVLETRIDPPQEITYRTGFRRFDLKGGRPTLNGNPVKFRGVNHLTFHPQHGMHTPEAWLRECLALMKRANVNAIRTHFLGPAVLADLCDEMGIYLLQELPIDWGTNYIHDPEWVGPALLRIEGGIRRDRHQPAVMVWAVGNENMPESQAVEEAGWNHLRIYHQFCKRLDPSRPTMFPPPGPANKITGIFEVRVGDIADTHYSFNLAKEFLKTGRVKNPRSWEADFEELTREEALARGWSGVWFSSEYGIHNMHPDLLNAPYNSIIDDVREDIYSGKNSLQVAQDRLTREWGFMRAEPTCLGGAYFPWICAGAGKGPDGNPWGWVRWCEDADWGRSPPTSPPSRSSGPCATPSARCSSRRACAGPRAPRRSSSRCRTSTTPLT